MRSVVKALLSVVIVFGLTFGAMVSHVLAQAEPPNQPGQPKYRSTLVKVFDDREALVLRDAQGVVRHLRHMGQPVRAEWTGLDEDKATARGLADAYVRKVAPLLSLQTAWVANLAKAEPPSLRDEGTDVRFSGEKKVSRATLVSYIQTNSGLPIWQASISVTVLDRPLRITSATNTIHPEVKVSKLGADAAMKPGRVTAELLVKSLGQEGAAAVPPKINVSRPLIYQYHPHQRIDPAVKANEGRRGLEGGPPTLPLPPVPEPIRPGEHYLVNEVLFTLPVEGIDVNWRAFLDVQTGAVLYLRAGVAHATGQVYVTDPMTATGDNAPTAPLGQLDPLRSGVTLAGLDPPSGSGSVQTLTGEFVQLVDVQPPICPPPLQLAPFAFNGSVTTDIFAAANAYHHSDALFRMVADMGINVSDFFDGTSFPVPVDHRGLDNERNAQAPINSTWTGSDGFRFGVAADGTSVTIAAAWRVVLHEFSHALLEDAVHSPNFGFAHSAGDSLAAILNDPGSQAPDRFLTFPWVNLTTRRHDRGVADNWGWGGSNDVGSYKSEQILSTTLFRAYRATGGDSSSLAAQQLAARTVANLIVRGIWLLATDPPTPTPIPDIYEAAMMDADQSTDVIEGHPGGAVHKVIRWAFEKQGLHRLPGTPTTSEGDPPPVDVYVDDGRHGEYLPHLQNFWQTADVWNRNKPDGGTTHQPPVMGATNFLYVRVKNRGTKTAKNVTVRTYLGRLGVGLTWPKGFQRTSTPVLPGSGSKPLSIPSGGTAIVGPFEWTLPSRRKVCVLASVSATNDLSNIDPASPLPVNLGPTALWRLVPFDNNIALRNLVRLPVAGGAAALVKALESSQFTLHNPYDRKVDARVEIVVPKFLAQRDWKVQAKDGAFRLQPRASQEITLSVTRGKDFKPEELIAVRGGVNIEAHALIDHLPVGGVTYRLDPRLR